MAPRKNDPPKNRVSCNSSIWPYKATRVFVVKIALSSCSWPQPPNFSRIRRIKFAGRKPAGKNAASRKSAEKVCQPAEYKKKNSAGRSTFHHAVGWLKMQDLKMEDQKRSMTWKCRTWKCRTKLQGMKMQDLKMRDHRNRTGKWRTSCRKRLHKKSSVQ